MSDLDMSDGDWAGVMPSDCDDPGAPQRDSERLESFILRMPYEVDLSVNSAYGQRGQRRFLKRHVRAWRHGLAWLARRHYHQVQDWGRPLRVSWSVVAPEDWRVRDPDNWGKVICDGLREGLEVDDSEFVIGYAQVVQGADPCIAVIVSEGA